MICLWRICVYTILGIVWYFSQYGQVLTQCIVFFLCYLSIPHVIKTIYQERSTQTEELAKEEGTQESITDDHTLCCDEADSNTTQAELPGKTSYPHVKKSLMQVFQCAYQQVVLPWYCVPESCNNQPLYLVFCREFDCVLDRLISRAKDFDVIAASVSCIRILTHHIRNAKNPDRGPLFSSREEEVAVLRRFSTSLVQNLFPESLWGLDVNRCALNEIVALNVLELLVRWLSDPDNLNQLVVSQLDIVKPKSPVEELRELDSGIASLASQDCGCSGAMLNGTENPSSTHKSKKTANKLKVGWSKFMHKVKYKKAEKKEIQEMEQNVISRSMNYQDGWVTDGEGSDQEGSIHSQQDFGMDDGDDPENFSRNVPEDMIEFTLSYEMWRVGQWTISVPHVEWENHELSFMVHLEERDNPDNLHWDVRKTYTDVICFRNKWQDSTHLPSLSLMKDKYEGEGKDEVKEEARTSLEHFLQELVSDDLMGNTKPVFKFLCPIHKLLNEEEHYGGVWGLLSNLADFLSPSLEEEEPNTSVDVSEPGDLNLHCPEDAIPAAYEIPGEKCEDTTNEPTPTTIISRSSLPSELKDGDELEADCVQSDSPRRENSPDYHTEDFVIPFTIPKKLKIPVITLCISPESVASQRSMSDKHCVDSDCKTHIPPDNSLLMDFVDGPSRPDLSGKLAKNDVCTEMAGGVCSTKETNQKSHLKMKDSQSQKKGQSNWDQLEATKALLDLLKQMSGNSILLNIFHAVLKPVMPLLEKKVSAFLSKLNPSETQMALYIDNACEKQWPKGLPAPPSLPRSSAEINETRERAQQLILQYSKYLILKKTDLERVFRLFQSKEENKTLAYMVLSFLLRELLPDDDALKSVPRVLQKGYNYQLA